MLKPYREHWKRHVQQVLRSRHYSWLAEARDGEPVEDVMTDVVADVMHICELAGIPWRRLLDQGRQQFEQEERVQEHRIERRAMAAAN